jgi:hypothetical protein
VEQELAIDTSAQDRQLGIIRRRRWYLWGVILVYLPATVLTLELTQSYRATGVVIFLWIIVLCVAVTLVAVVKCPQCGNYFHMRNSMLHPSRHCCHCGLHLKSGQK